MAEKNWKPEELLGLPEDLRAHVGEASLVRLVFEALHTPEFEAGPSLKEPSLPAGRPRVLLTILTYAYAMGLYGSEQIESQIGTDKELRYLSARALPSADSLRRFRRTHRALLERSLSRLMQLAWLSRWSALKQRGPLSLQAGPCWGEISELCQRAAEGRINDAVLIDSMAMDY